MGNPRNYAVAAGVTRDERARLYAIARSLGLTPSAWARGVLLDEADRIDRERRIEERARDA
jgi:phage terminase small subunit